MVIFDLIYTDPEDRAPVERTFRRLFPQAKIEDASDFIHESRFSVELDVAEDDYLETVAWEGLSGLSLITRIKFSDAATFIRIKERLEARKKAETEALKKRWEELNGNEFFGCTFEEFGKMQFEAIEKLAKENKKFAEFIGRV